jgi:hypothetical protein
LNARTAQKESKNLPRYEEGWQSPESLSLKRPGAPPIEIARDYADLPKDAPIPTGYRLLQGAPKPESIHELVAHYGGRFYEGPRCFQQEPHWPFAWWAAQHDWILRLDADEFPSDELREWIVSFKKLPNVDEFDAYLAIWPLWDGHRSVTRNWPDSRPFLVRSRGHRFFGMVEQTAIPQKRAERLKLTLIHAPARKSYGVRNIVFRRQAYVWRSVIAGSLINSPLRLPRWRDKENKWPEPWQTKIRHPFRQAVFSLLWFPLCQARDMWRFERKIDLSACINPSLHHFLLQLAIVREKYSAWASLKS